EVEPARPFAGRVEPVGARGERNADLAAAQALGLGGPARRALEIVERDPEPIAVGRRRSKLGLQRAVEDGLCHAHRYRGTARSSRHRNRQASSFAAAEQVVAQELDRQRTVVDERLIERALLELAADLVLVVALERQDLVEAEEILAELRGV